MIAGVGVDMIEVDRVATRIEKEAGFRELVYSKGEIEYCETKTRKFEHYAARFAAKEAFFKALGTGWVAGTAFNEIEIVHNEQGKPKINLLGLTADSSVVQEISKISVSLSHLKTIATAIVILEK
ncbi:MAG: holo-ACP synthase [Chitinophagaceae bacterium]|nr:holo-ACP synthase [Chitinophagaceae bacterium]